MAGGRNYTITTRTGKDGTQYVRITEVLPAARSRPVDQWVSTLAESLTTLKTGFQKAFRFATRRA